jgi:DNA-binding IclR family transcriptional regulator
LDEASLEDYLLRLKDDTSRGWAVNYGESSLDEVGVAAPVYDHRGDVVAAVLIAAPRFRVSKERLQVLGESCMTAADKVTARLGGNAPSRGDR